MKSVYLAGPIRGRSDSEASLWRNRAAESLPDCRVLDPMDRDFRGREDEYVCDIVEGDKRDIERADVVLANCWTPSWGTAMEIHYAYTRDTPVIVVCPHSASPWVRYHAAGVYDSLESACAEVRES